MNFNQLTCTCGSESSWSSSPRSRLYLCPGADTRTSRTSRQRDTASPVGARDGDITVQLILSYNWKEIVNEMDE